MKALRKHHILILLIGLMIGKVSTGQTPDDRRQLRREKNLKEKEFHFQQAKQLIQQKNFAVTAESIQWENQTPRSVSPVVNFLLVEEGNAVLQIAPMVSQERGLNNLGGFTLKGTPDNIQYQERKKRVVLSFTLTGAVGTARIAVSLSGSDKALITIDPVFTGQQIRMTGRVITPEKARVFIGTEL